VKSWLGCQIRPLTALSADRELIGAACVGEAGYNCAVAGTRRDDFPNNFVGDLVKTERGWTVVPPTCCPAGHDYGDGGWSVSSVWCTCNGRHMAWRCAN
jgi:hypothetical protein